MPHAFPSRLPATAGAVVESLLPHFAQAAVRDASSSSGAWPVHELTSRMRALDDAAWREFHQRYFRRLWRFATVLHRGDDGAAEETVQQTFLRAVRHIREFEDEQVFWCWLVRLARTAAADHTRGQRRYLAALDRLRDWRESARAPELAPGWEPLLAECLDACDGEERQLLHDRYFEAHSLAQIAETHGLTAKAVERRLARARERLRALLLERLRTDRPS